MLPVDVMVCHKLEAGAACKVGAAKEIPEGWMIADIGPEHHRHFGPEDTDSQTVLWNGPMGVFEIEAFARGTRDVAKAMAESKGYHRSGRRFIPQKRSRKWA